MRKLTETEKIHNLRRSDVEMQKRSEEKHRKRDRESTPYNSEIIDALKTNSGNHHTIKKIFAVAKIPNNFSLITNPKDSLIAIFKLANTARSGGKIKRYQFDHSDMQTVDLSAECILALVASEIQREHRSTKRKKLEFDGVYPKDISLKRLLRGVGIIKHLHIKHEYLKPSQEEKIEVFEGKSQKDSTTDAGASSDAELAAKNLVDHINRCLRKTGRRLTDTAVTQLSAYAGEVLDNATEHSGKRSWFIRGYYDHDCEPYYCGIAIINFGKTIAETFSEIDEDSYAYKEISPYLKKHSRKGHFSSKWNKEDLMTLMALQSQVSSKNQNKKDTRGMGTVEMIEFFDSIARECSSEHKPEMAILSGSTHIRFDGKYHLSPDRSGRGIIAFNDTNNLNFPPNPDYVSNIKPLCFPGSVISIRFALPENQSLRIDP